jgi:hypothetical protein
VYPVPQLNPQLVPSQVGEPCSGAVHVVQLVPQALTSLATHALLQSWVLPGQAGTQLVPLQVTVPPVGAAHLVQLAPQALTSSGTHVPEHRRVPEVHWHWLLTQCSPPVHLLPHPLQSLSSLVVSTHAPLHAV